MNHCKILMDVLDTRDTAVDEADFIDFIQFGRVVNISVGKCLLGDVSTAFNKAINNRSLYKPLTEAIAIMLQVVVGNAFSLAEISTPVRHVSMLANPHAKLTLTASTNDAGDSTAIATILAVFQ